MRRGLLEFGKAARGADMAIVFFAGHGMEMGGDNWLVPVDAELKSDLDTEQEAISLRNVVRDGVRRVRSSASSCWTPAATTRSSRRCSARAASRAVGRGGLARVEPAWQRAGRQIRRARHGGQTGGRGTHDNPAFTALEGKLSDVRKEVYRETGVDTAEADAGLHNIVARVQGTWPRAGLGRVILPIGYFANVIEIDGKGIALCTDGVGSKTIIADMMGKYDTIGIDCVAMNVNDMICVGAKPVSMVDYIAVEQANAAMLDAVGAGLCEGARMAGISISGGETAQLKDIVHGFDLVGMAVGCVDLDKVLSGKGVAPGDVVIGVRSNGVHSNGLTLARRAFFANGTYGSITSSTSSAPRSARSCCGRPISTSPKRWKSCRASLESKPSSTSPATACSI